jgi:hypothetical protein
MTLLTMWHLDAEAIGRSVLDGGQEAPEAQPHVRSWSPARHKADSEFESAC